MPAAGQLLQFAPRWRLTSSFFDRVIQTYADSTFGHHAIGRPDWPIRELPHRAQK